MTFNLKRINLVAILVCAISVTVQAHPLRVLITGASIDETNCVCKELTDKKYQVLVEQPSLTSNRMQNKTTIESKKIAEAECKEQQPNIIFYNRGWIDNIFLHTNDVFPKQADDVMPTCEQYANVYKSSTAGLLPHYDLVIWLTSTTTIYHDLFAYYGEQFKENFLVLDYKSPQAQVQEILNCIKPLLNQSHAIDLPILEQQQPSLNPIARYFANKKSTPLTFPAPRPRTPRVPLLMAPLLQHNRAHSPRTIISPAQPNQMCITLAAPIHLNPAPRKRIPHKPSLSCSSSSPYMPKSNNDSSN